jgi:hypothetical protein
MLYCWGVNSAGESEQRHQGGSRVSESVGPG